MDIIAKTKAQLIDMGCTGLYCEGECACTFDDLAPCGDAEINPGQDFINGCEPGHHFVDPEDSGNWVVRRDNKAPTKEEWDHWRVRF